MLRSLYNDLEGIASAINVNYSSSIDRKEFVILCIKGQGQEKFIGFLHKLGFENTEDIDGMIYSITSEKVRENEKYIEKCLNEMRKEIKNNTELSYGGSNVISSDLVR